MLQDTPSPNTNIFHVLVSQPNIVSRRKRNLTYFFIRETCAKGEIIIGNVLVAILEILCISNVI